MACPVCGQPTPRDDAKYCSRDCYLETVQANRRTVECANCGEEFTRPEWHFKQSEGLHFCDRGCMGAYNSSKTGEDAWAWKGGYDDPTTDIGVWTWRKIRRRTLARDGYECWACGLSDDANRALIGQGLDIHHEDEPTFEKTITSCRFCHSAFD